MEIHRPKPFHGWREFAKEIGVIVIGIAIALGGEQVIERLQRHAEVSEARKALRSEIAANAHAAKYNVEYGRCLVALGGRITEFASVGRPLPVGGPPPTDWFTPGTVNWDVVKAGAAAHMPLGERLAYARAYNDVGPILGITGTQGEIWLRLAGPGSYANLTPAKAQTLVDEASRAQLADNDAIKWNRKLLYDAKAVGVEYEPLSVEERTFLRKFCNAVGVSPQLD